jgi:hypothetical protein
MKLAPASPHRLRPRHRRPLISRGPLAYDAVCGARIMRSVAISLLATLVTGLQAAAEAAQFDDPRWSFATDEEIAHLMFAIPNTDIIDFHASCKLGSGQARVRVSFELPEEAGKTIKFKFLKGSTVLEFDADVPKEPDGIETYDPSMTIPIGSEVFVLLGRGESIDIAAGGDTGSIPLEGAAPHVASFIKACSTKTSRPACGAGRGTCEG